MGNCESQDTRICSEEFQSIPLPNLQQEFTDEFTRQENQVTVSQSKKDFDADLPIQTTQNNLNSHPLSKTLYIIYNKCRIERPIEVEDGTYQGQWFAGKQCGFGRMYYKNKDYYEGFWLLGRKHHMGIFIQLNQQPLIGEWFDDKFLGTDISPNLTKDPTLSYSDLLNVLLLFTIMQLQPVQIQDSLYYGQYSNNGKQGLGLCLKKGEYKFIGYFSNDKKQGYGIEITKNEVYRGGFKDGVRSGLGHLKKNKNFFIGQFENNQPTTNGISIQI
ncbi:unnamed protein product (macronuclear) [Paramecium tetraurelia]|uniref:MORN repeat protein n=1 Tax=Paramecium tetraurelia TaxID=5888 RepID=A0EFY4_PARTE|nr:uncharacterized protein GSPATT00026548001 [Paramecium tetraurelia]CAK94225.1 unnamed protein product [Paramecium tetraurelia]|eukprot:XP_001461598.1 hypothetical protein (macronuclear) [Paramecium tetraurelia strain d4-2]